MKVCTLVVFFRPAVLVCERGISGYSPRKIATKNKHTGITDMNISERLTWRRSWALSGWRPSRGTDGSRRNVCRRKGLPHIYISIFIESFVKRTSLSMSMVASTLVGGLGGVTCLGLGVADGRFRSCCSIRRITRRIISSEYSA